jgi:anti-anti-sigma factor
MSGVPVGRLEIEPVDDVAVVRLLGEHDLASTPALRASLLTLIEEGFGVVVDCTETEFMDVAVLRRLLEADEALRGRGRRLAVLLATQCPVERFVETVSVEQWLAVTSERSVAIRLAGSSSQGGSS